MKSTLAQLLELKRSEYRKSSQINSQVADSYARSVKVDFVAVLNRHFHKLRVPHEYNHSHDQVNQSYE